MKSGDQLSDELADRLLCLHFKGPPGIEVFEDDLTISQTTFKALVKSCYKLGYEHRDAELQQEKAEAYDRILATAKLKEIKLPFWKRWLLRRTL